VRFPVNRHRLWQLAADGALIALAWWLAFWLRFDKGVPAPYDRLMMDTILVVIATKAFTGRGTPLRGGLPSGHAAVAFGGWMAVTNVMGDSTHWFLVSSLTFLMALLVAQTRVESGVHSFLEVTYGGLLGSLAVLVIFQVFA